MNSYFGSLRIYYNGGILETDVFCYPTPNLRELKRAKICTRKMKKFSVD